MFRTRYLFIHSKEHQAILFFREAKARVGRVAVSSDGVDEDGVEEDRSDVNGAYSAAGNGAGSSAANGAGGSAGNGAGSLAGNGADSFSGMVWGDVGRIIRQMEGFLLVFSQECRAQIQYCVLEHGMICCYDQPGGALRESIRLTRHRIRVLPHGSDDAGVCPNRFTVHALEVKRNDEANKFVLAGKREKKYLFAAVTSKIMIKWANAVQNWRRHTFDDPISCALSVHDAITNNEIQNPDIKQRALLLESQRAQLVNLAIRFDVQLVRWNPESGKAKSRGLLTRPAFSQSSNVNALKASSFAVLILGHDEFFQIHIICQTHAACVNAKYTAFRFNVWKGKLNLSTNLSIDTTRTNESRVKALNCIRRHNNLYVATLIKTIQLVQKLQHGTLNFTSATTARVITLASNRINFVNEHNRRRMIVCYAEHLTDKFWAIAQVLLNQLGANNTQKCS
ncbi:hypothetical protein PsorP6_000134 [Peronosclerospora sorghi]|uniref:Uncharacterized protein n=1 Tax=Peronosclerospora sorghi TaxID=230839 RepID=A0ACC0WUK6_9STRA|nr:hypothetical protein PsorP6_000134 [Peronosclerospora sorghi]